MNTRGANSFIEVPQPLFKYGGEKVIHDDNLAILSIHENAAKLDRKTLRAYKKQLNTIQKRLQRDSADALLERYQEATQERNSLQLHIRILRHTYETLDECYQQVHEHDSDSDTLIYIAAIAIRCRREAAKIQTELKPIRETISEIVGRLRPLRADIARRNRLRSQIESHYAAVDDEKKQEVLQRGMAEEANLVVEQITSSLARMGFKHTYTKGNKTITERVKFDYVVATPDQIHCKLLASKQGLFGGSIDLLPEGVYVTEIIQPKVMNELSVTLEREVWSPHTSEENIPLVNGAWIIIERLGLVEGIPRNVTYRQLMARYETAEHSKFPIPAGLRRGRRVNWVHLDSPSGIHLMFTGISGSGKSNAMRAMVSAIVEKQSPRDIMFAFVDLKKQGDFREFESAPHCLTIDGKGVLTEISEVVEVLKRVRSEMHARQTKIGYVANNLIDYNKRVQPEDRMPRLVVVFDEYANTRRTRFSEEADIIDDICIEIGQVGRAAGVSLWIGIQQPRRDNMPSSLRDNITTQFVGHQANVGAAQSVTGNRESLKLEDFPGRMSASVGWKTEKVQMPFISEDDVKRAVQIAVDTYGGIEPYELTYDADEIPEVLTDTELILQAALEELNGGLKIYDLHDLLKAHISRPKIRDIIKELVNQQVIEFKGILYEVQKNGRAYELVETDNNSLKTA